METVKYAYNQMDAEKSIQDLRDHLKKLGYFINETKVDGGVVEFKTTKLRTTTK